MNPIYPKELISIFSVADDYAKSQNKKAIKQLLRLYTNTRVIFTDRTVDEHILKYLRLLKEIKLGFSGKLLRLFPKSEVSMRLEFLPEKHREEFKKRSAPESKKEEPKKRQKTDEDDQISKAFPDLKPGVQVKVPKKKLSGALKSFIIDNAVLPQRTSPQDLRAAPAVRPSPNNNPAPEIDLSKLFPGSDQRSPKEKLLVTIKELFDVVIEKESADIDRLRTVLAVFIPEESFLNLIDPFAF